jgi:hypothetical protein
VLPKYTEVDESTTWYTGRDTLDAVTAAKLYTTKVIVPFVVSAATLVLSICKLAKLYRVMFLQIALLLVLYSDELVLTTKQYLSILKEKCYKIK